MEKSYSAPKMLKTVWLTRLDHSGTSGVTEVDLQRGL